MLMERMQRNVKKRDKSHMFRPLAFDNMSLVLTHIITFLNKLKGSHT